MKSNCPICDASLMIGKDLVESEVLECNDCHRKIVIKSLDKKIMLVEAPAVEEDWGE